MPNQSSGMLSDQQIRAELTRADLQQLTVVRMALSDLDANNLDGAIARLLTDADKLRSYETPLNQWLRASI